MNSFIRSKIISLWLRFAKNNYFESWQEAAAVARNDGYLNNDLNRFRAARFELNHNYGTNKHRSKEIDYAINFIREHIDSDDKLSIVDFGGADGAFLSQLQSVGVDFLGVVVESRSLIEVLPDIVKKKFLYSEKIPDSVDIVYTASALNYIEDSYAVATSAFRCAKRAVILQRNCFSNDEQYCLQWSSLYSNGWGAIPSGWSDTLISYPHHTLQVVRLLQIASEHGFVLKDIIGNRSGVVGRASSGQYGIDLFFVRSK